MASNYTDKNTVVDRLESNFDNCENHSHSKNNVITSNFAFLNTKNLQHLAKLDSESEGFIKENRPVHSLMTTRQFGEFLARQVANKNRLDIKHNALQYFRLEKLESEGVINSQIAYLFHSIREKGNDATHYLIGIYETALANLE